jgi:hypothetical protein
MLAVSNERGAFLSSPLICGVNQDISMLMQRFSDFSRHLL